MAALFCPTYCARPYAHRCAATSLVEAAFDLAKCFLARYRRMAAATSVTAARNAWYFRVAMILRVLVSSSKHACIAEMKAHRCWYLLHPFAMHVAAALAATISFRNR